MPPSPPPPFPELSFWIMGARHLVFTHIVGEEFVAPHEQSADTDQDAHEVLLSMVCSTLCVDVVVYILDAGNELTLLQHA